MEVRSRREVEIGLQPLANPFDIEAAVRGHDSHAELVEDVVIGGGTQRNVRLEAVEDSPLVELL